jgi:hypothetical protein
MCASVSVRLMCVCVCVCVRACVCVCARVCQPMSNRVQLPQEELPRAVTTYVMMILLLCPLLTLWLVTVETHTHGLSGFY